MADRQSAYYLDDLSSNEMHNAANATVFKTIYRNLQVDHAISDQELSALLSMLTGPKQEAGMFRSLVTGVLIDASHGKRSSITRDQMIRIAITCKPLLTDPWLILREDECSFLYRSRLPEAETDILPITRDPHPLIRQHALILIKKIETERLSSLHHA